MPTSASGTVRQGRWHGPSITYSAKSRPVGITLLQPTRRAAVLGQPSSLLPRWERVNGGWRGMLDAGDEGKKVCDLLYSFLFPGGNYGSGGAQYAAG
jgi:hypothetical protein